MTLLQFWQQQLTIHRAAQTAAQQDLAAAQAVVQDATKRLADDQKKLAQASTDIAATRAQLAATANPADGAALLSTLTGFIISQRARQGVVLDDEDEIAAAQAAVTSAGATLARATARIAATQATVSTVTADHTRREAYKSAIAAPALNTVKADATAVLASAVMKRATARIGKNFPAEILTIADKRRATRVKRLKSLQANVDAAQDALGARGAADNGLAGATAPKAIAFQRAERAVANYVATAVARLAAARAVLGKLEAIEVDTKGTVPDVLTAAEKAQLTAEKEAGKAAEPAAEVVDAALNGVFAAQDALAVQILTSIETDVDALSTDPKVAAERAAIDTASTAFKNALATFTAANKSALDQWEVAIPDAAWSVLLDYETATAALTELAAIDPAALTTAMDNAQSDYATARGAAEVAQRRADCLGDVIALRQDALDAAQKVITARLPSAIRGDSY